MLSTSALSGVWPHPPSASWSPPFHPAGSHPPSNVHVPLSDTRSYRALTLSNGLRALIVHDPRVDKAAAALSVHVGHLSDPRALPGLSHFTEHMLFLGTRSFPDESSYKRFLREHGGSSNASTSAEATTYHFSVHHGHLSEALARFCSFFTCPLFTESATEREVNAVDSENARNLTLDGRRELQVSKHLAGTKSVWSKFGTGDATTLSPHGVDIRSALLSHYERFYSANIMTLSVIGRESLDDLERIVTGSTISACGVASDFAAIVNTGIDVPLHDDAPPELHFHPYQHADLARCVYITPIKDIRKLSVSWPIPTLPIPDYSGTTRLLAHLLGHEGQGSLLSLLKRHAWANGLDAGGTSYRSFSTFEVEVSLTPLGLEHVDDIVRLTLQAVALIRSAEEHTLATAHAELATISANGVRFRPETPPESAVQGAVSALQRFPSVDVLVGSALLPVFCPIPLKAALACICAPRHMLVTVTSKSFGDTEGQASLALKHADALETRTEPYYKFNYALAPFSTAQLELWGASKEVGPLLTRVGANEWDLTPPNLPLHPDMCMPEANTFIASDFSLRPLPDSALDATSASAGAGSTPTLPDDAATSLPPHALDMEGLSFSSQHLSFTRVFSSPTLLTSGVTPKTHPALPAHVTAAVIAHAHALQCVGSTCAGGMEAIASFERELRDAGGLPTRVFFMQDTQFRLPKTMCKAIVRLPCHKLLCAQKGSIHRALAPLFSEVLRDLLTETTYAASVAGMQCHLDVDVDDDAFGLHVSGYSSKHSALLEKQLEVLVSLVDGSVSDAIIAPIFERHLEARKRSFANWRKAQPIDRAALELREALTHPCPSYESWFSDLDRVSLPALREFARGLFDSGDDRGEGGAYLGASIELLLYGNVHPADALATARMLSLTLGRAGAVRPRAELALLAEGARASVNADATAAGVPPPLLDARFHAPLSLSLPPRSDVTLTRRHPHAEQRNAAVVMWLQLGPSTPRTRACARLLGLLISEPFFTQLRTKEQLGYVVSAGAREGALSSLVFRVQSSNASVDHVTSRIDSFLTAFRETLAALGEKDISEKARILRDRSLEPDKTQGAVCSRLWEGIESNAFTWDHMESSCAALEHITAHDLLSLWDARVMRGGPLVRRISCRVYAQHCEGEAAEGAMGHGCTSTIPVPREGEEEVAERDVLSFKARHAQAASNSSSWLPRAEFLPWMMATNRV